MWLHHDERYENPGRNLQDHTYFNGGGEHDDVML